jgi:hypothetical protein
MRARLDEVERRMEAAGVPQILRFHQQGAYLKQVLVDEQTGNWHPLGTTAEEAPETALAMPSLAPAALPVQANAPRESRASMWARAVSEANRETFAQGDPAPPSDPQVDAGSATQIMPPAGSAQRSRAAWGAAVLAANAELIRKGGKVSEV